MAKFFLTGEQAEGVEYIPTALTELRRMKAEGLTTANRTVMLSKKASVRIALDPTLGDRVYIHVLRCPTVPFSGFMDTFRLPDAYGDTPSHTTEQAADAQKVAELWTTAFPPATVPEPKFYGVRTKTTPGALSHTSLLPLDGGSPTAKEDSQGNLLGGFDVTLATSKFKRMYERYTPSKFTGLMREVMQCSIQRLVSVSKTELLPIDYKYGSSYGVLKNPTAKGDQQKYFLFLITQNSVYYVPAEFCISSALVNGVATDVIQLISVSNENAKKIGDIPIDIEGSWSNELGWAYSYTTPVASMVCVGGELQEGHMYKTVELCHISFAFDALSGQPTTATVQRGNPHIFWLDRPMTKRSVGVAWGLLNVPQYGIPYPETKPRLYNESVDFGIPYPYRGQRPANYKATDIPVYAYYTEAHGLVTCKYSYDKDGGVTAHEDTNVQGSTFPTYKFDTGGENSIKDNRPGGGATGEIAVVRLTSSGDPLSSVWVFNREAGTWGHPPATLDADNIVGMGSGSSYAEALAAAKIDAWTDWKYPSWRLETIGYNYVPPAVPDPVLVTAHPESGGAAPNDPKWRYVSDAYGQWSGYNYPAGTYVGDMGAPTYTEINVDGMLVTNEEVKSDSSLTLSLLDREMHLVYSVTTKAQVTMSYSTTDKVWHDSARQETKTKEELYLYGGYATPIKLNAEAFGQNRRMVEIHPEVNDLTFKSSQAAFDSDGVAYNVVPGVTASSVVRMSGIGYAVQNPLFGWIGVI